MKKSLNSLALMLLISIVGISQPVKFKINDLSELKSRLLVVELLEVSEDKVKSWEKIINKGSKKSPDFKVALAQYMAFVEDYNAFIQEVVMDSWDLNSKIEFKTTSEINELRSTKREIYTLLRYFPVSQSTPTSTSIFKGYYPNKSMPALIYTRIEKFSSKSDYTFYMPFHNQDQSNKLVLSDIQLSIKLMKLHLNHMEDKGETSMFRQYVKEMAQRNCKDFQGKDIFIRESEISEEESFNDIQNAYAGGKVSLIDDDQVFSAIENRDDMIIGFCIPHTTPSGGGYIGKELQNYLLKTFINVSSGKIYTFEGLNVGANKWASFNADYFSSYSNCH